MSNSRSLWFAGGRRCRWLEAALLLLWVSPDEHLSADISADFGRDDYWLPCRYWKSAISSRRFSDATLWRLCGHVGGILKAKVLGLIPKELAFSQRCRAVLPMNHSLVLGEAAWKGWQSVLRNAC